jgi:acyl dehydratase
VGARELQYWRVGSDAGMAFAVLTGDFNPVHWMRPYARALGFKSKILHGFATLARALEGLNRALYAGAVDRIRTVDVRFTRPLCLPARVGLYLDGDTFMVGDAPGGPAYLVGTLVSSDDAAMPKPPVERPS